MATFLQLLRFLSMVLLAAAIAYLGYALIRTADRVALIMDRAETIAESVKPVADLTPEFLKESEQLRGLATEAVAEVEAVRLLVPSVLEESAAIRNSLPPVLTQTERMLAESARIRAEVAQVRAQIPALLAELKAYRTLVPDVLEESRRVRLTIPPTLDRVEDIVLEANEIASSAGENVFTGMITGIVKAPITLLGNVTEFLVPSDVKMSSNDQARLKRRLKSFLETAELGDTLEFDSSDGLVTVKFKLVSEAPTGTQECRKLAVESFSKGKLLKRTQIEVCRDDQGEWLLKSSG